MGPPAPSNVPEPAYMKTLAPKSGLCPPDFHYSREIWLVLRPRAFVTGPCPCKDDHHQCLKALNGWITSSSHRDSFRCICKHTCISSLVHQLYNLRSPGIHMAGSTQTQSTGGGIRCLPSGESWWPLSWRVAMCMVLRIQTQKALSLVCHAIPRVLACSGCWTSSSRAVPSSISQGVCPNSVRGIPMVKGAWGRLGPVAYDRCQYAHS